MFQAGDLRRHEIGVDYGPLGELKENIAAVVAPVVTGRDDVVGLDSSIILPREVWVASATSRCSTTRW